MSQITQISGAKERVELHQVIPLAEPFSLYLYPTNNCNFRCSYCVHSLSPRVLQENYHFTNEYMTLDTFQHVLNGLSGIERPLKTMIFVGQGEPLLNQDLPKMIRLAKESGLTQKTEIITNASLLTPEMSNLFIEAGLDVLRVSVQGITADQYREICHYDLDFQQFVEHLKYFFRHKKHTELYVKIVDAALASGEEQIFYNIFKDITDKMFVEQIKPVYAGVTYGNTEGTLLTDRYGNEHPPRTVCPLPFYMLTIWPNGDVCPCEAIYKPIVLGNVNRDHLLSLWRGEAIKGFWRQQLQSGKNSIPLCRLCCAPDDVSHPKDVLDDHRQTLLLRLAQDQGQF